MERLRRLRAVVEAWLGAMSGRERVLVTAAALVVALFGIWLVAHAYRRREAERESVEARLNGPPVQLMSHIAQAGATLGIQVNDLRPTGAPTDADGLREESVEVNLARIELGRLAQLMQSLERGAGVVRVRRVRVSTRSDDPALVDATLVVSTYQLRT
jgi:general secretion pathway protein M